MHLLGKPIKPMKYTHWLSQLLPPRLEDDEKEALIPEILRGDAAAIKRAIEGHMGLIGRIVGCYAWQAPNKVDDMLSVGFLTCCEGVNIFAQGDLSHENLTGYLSTKIHGAIFDFLIEDQTVRPSKKLVKRDMKDMTYSCELSDIRNREIIHQFDTPTDLIEEIGIRDVEKIVAVMAIEGYTDREIAATIKKSSVWVGKIRKTVGQRILGALGND